MTAPANKLPIPTRDELLARYEELGTFQAVAESYGCSYWTVANWAKQLGITATPDRSHPQRPTHPWYAGTRGVVWGRGRGAE